MTTPERADPALAAQAGAPRARRDAGHGSTRQARALSEPIAIIGMGCRFPGGADAPEAFWQLLRDGVDAVREVPADRWDVERVYDPDPDAPGKIYTRRGGFPRRRRRLRPAVLRHLAARGGRAWTRSSGCCWRSRWEALEHAGQAPDRLAGSRTGVFVGIGVERLRRSCSSRPATSTGIDAYYASGIAHSIASGRVSYCSACRARALTVDTACSSSLVAVHLACQSLRAGRVPDWRSPAAST